MEQLAQAIQKMKNGKTTGHDEITADVIKALDESGLNELLKLLDDIRAEKMTPKDWKIGIICPIYKREIVNNARTIKE